MADLHFGKLTWNEETGQDYDIEIARTIAKAAFTELLGYVQHLAVEKIVLPLGNDFFNVNGAGEFTVNGTRQVEDTRWQKTFREGRRLLVELIDMAAQIAPVDVLIVPGNHDRERMFYAGDALECWYHNSPNVTVDNRAAVRKYYVFGKNLIGFTHGSEEKFAALPAIMAHEEPVAWGSTTHREWHLGDRHHKEMLVQRVKETDGVTIRLMLSLTSVDEWHYRTGWVGAEQAAESYLWRGESLFGVGRKNIVPHRTNFRSSKRWLHAPLKVEKWAAMNLQVSYLVTKTMIKRHVNNQKPCKGLSFS